MSESSLDNQFQALMYRPLLQSWWEDGRLHYLTAEENPMALARRWEYAGEDSATLVYHLRTDARWSDGQPVTAHDAAWTLDAQGDRATASPRQDYNQNIESIEAVDDSTLVVRFTHQYPEMFFHSAEMWRLGTSTRSGIGPSSAITPRSTTPGAGTSW
jgi:ABC-type transport system substrate-binding protein